MCVDPLSVSLLESFWYTDRESTAGCLSICWFFVDLLISLVDFMIVSRPNDVLSAAGRFDLLPPHLLIDLFSICGLCVYLLWSMWWFHLHLLIHCQYTGCLSICWLDVVLLFLRRPADGLSDAGILSICWSPVNLLAASWFMDCACTSAMAYNDGLISIS